MNNVHEILLYISHVSDFQIEIIINNMHNIMIFMYISARL